MRQVFDSREFDEAEGGRETELTLGATSLLVIGFGLILLCGLFFGLGYATGHRSPTELAQALEKAPAAGSPAVASGSVPKPSPAPAPTAVANASDPTAQTSTDPDGEVVSNPALNPPANGSAPQTAGSASANPGTVRPALTPQTMQPSAAPMTGTPAVRYMVQIAAVSHAEDASVLTNALLHRGYAVTARRDPTDNLIHVQVGPFFDANAANAMRLKLLNDGYNAIVEP